MLALDENISRYYQIDILRKQGTAIVNLFLFLCPNVLRATVTIKF